LHRHVEIVQWLCNNLQKSLLLLDIIWKIFINDVLYPSLERFKIRDIVDIFYIERGLCVEHFDFWLEGTETF
jgi:hypothetical protein